MRQVINKIKLTTARGEAIHITLDMGNPKAEPVVRCNDNLKKLYETEIKVSEILLRNARERTDWRNEMVRG